jgi:hypothetical protein
MEKTTLIKIVFVVCIIASLCLVFSILTYPEQKVLDAMAQTCKSRNGTFISYGDGTLSCYEQDRGVVNYKVNVSYKWI